MKQYLDALKYILDNGEAVSDRTGVGTRSIFGYQMRFNLQDGFPAVTTKRLAWRAVVGELLWFLEGSTDERRLAEITYGKHRSEISDRNTIWTANADAQGKSLGYDNTDTVKLLGPVYGYQWRNFGGTDQVAAVVDQLKNTPDSRRIILSAWNVPSLPAMALPPCHVMSQFRVMNGKLHCQMYQRSQDAGLGAPFNIASYALLTHMFAQLANLTVGELIIVIGDMHIYNTHLDAIKEQLTKTPYQPPQLEMPKFDTIDELLLTTPDQYKLVGYKCHPTIKMDMAV